MGCTALALIACASDQEPSVSVASSQVTFPSDPQWTAVSQANVAMGDVFVDGTNSQGREIVGDAANPALMVFLGTTHYFVRLRLDESPLTSQGELPSFGWGLLLDTDSDLTDYEYAIFVDGIREAVSFQRNTTQQSVGDPQDNAEDFLYREPVVVTTSAANTAANVRVLPTGGDLNLDGNGDVYLDFAIPQRATAGTFLDQGTNASTGCHGAPQLGGELGCQSILDVLNPATQVRFIAGVSNNGRSLSVDLAGTTTTNSLSSAASDPSNLNGQSDTGCADGQREGFTNVQAAPKVAACSGGWSNANLRAAAQCNRISGDDSANPTGSGCAAEDLCGGGWHICTTSAEIAAFAPSGSCASIGAPANTFYATLQSGPGSMNCAATGNNDLFGCGTMGSAPAANCAPLDRFGQNQNSSLTTGGWAYVGDGTGTDEIVATTKSLATGGGVMCCRNPLLTPLAVADTGSVTEDAAATDFNVITNDTLGNAPNTIAITAGPTAAQGTASVVNNQVRFAPAANFTGTVIITYSLTDLDGESSSASLTITVGADNDVPAITSTAPDTATEDLAYSYDADSSDVDGPGATWSLGVGHTCGGTIDASTGEYAFTPAGPVPPASCVVAVRVCDGGSPEQCATQTTTVLISGVNGAPAITSTADATAAEGIAYAYDAESTDDDGPDATWSIGAADTCGGTIDASTGLYAFTPPGPTPPASCVVAVQICDGGSPARCTTQDTIVTIAPDNSAPAITSTAPTAATEDVAYSYDANSSDIDGPGATWSLGIGHTCGGAIDPSTGEYTFTPAGPTPPASCVLSIEVCDGGVPNQCATQAAAIAIATVNDAPAITNNAPTTTAEDSAYTYDADVTDVDGPGATWSLGAADTCGGAIDPSTGEYTFTAAGPAPPASCVVSVQVCDGGTPDQCATQDTTVTITPDNSAPTITSTAPAVAIEDEPYAYNATSADVDGPNATWSLTGDDTCGGMIDPSTGAYAFTPSGPMPPASCVVSVQVCDGGAPDQCATQTVTVTITSVNDGPVITSIAPSAATEDVELVYAAEAADGDGPTATWTVDAADTCGGAIDPGTGVYAATPAGPMPPSTCVIAVTVCDGATPSACATQTATVTIEAVNDDPIAMGDVANTNTSTAVTVDVLANDADPELATLVVTGATDGANGTVTINSDGTVTYTPVPGFQGTDTFAYTVSDGSGGVDTASVMVAVGIDTDADGCTDIDEAGMGTDPAIADTDGDGIGDCAEANLTGTDPLDDDSDDDGLFDGSEDLDGDGVIDPGETDPNAGDSDDDGVQDGTERGLTMPEGDDTEAGFVPDSDPTTTTDPTSPDSDGDGLDDGVEDADRDGQADAGETNAADDDSDDDGLLDGTEDADHDGMQDPGETDPLDRDSDGDGIQDGTEQGRTTPEGEDTGTGFIPDADPTTTTDPLDPDTDDGGVSDGNEDRDHDGQVDEGETDPNDPADDILDGDGDGTPDGEDNCPGVANADQMDSDGDGTGDACEDQDGDGVFDPEDPDDDGDGFVDSLGVSGGGCSVGGASHAAGGWWMIAVLVGIALAGQSRRRRAARAVALAAVGVASSASPVFAQRADEHSTFGLERLRMASDHHGIIDVESPEVLPRLAWGAGMWLGFADQPLIVYQLDTEREVGSLVEKRVGGSLIGAIGLGWRLELGIELPLVLYQGRDAAQAQVSPEMLPALSSFGAGDLRIAPKLRLLRGVAVQLGVELPTGRDDYRGGTQVLLWPELLIGRSYGAMRYAINVGFRMRDEQQFLNQHIDHEVTARVGIGLRVGDPDRTKAPVELGWSISGATSARNSLANTNQNALETNVMGGYRVSPSWLAFVGGGLGLGRGFGTPDWRAFVGIRVGRDRAAPEPQAKPAPIAAVPDPDRDRDGIADRDDACPDEQGLEELRGCPAKDSDGDQIADHKDTCVNDPEDVDGFSDSDGCPDPDNDDDRVLDVADACPNESGVADNRGCPDTDRDGDTVVDRLDNCPDEPGTVANHGCKTKQLVQITQSGLAIAETIYFKTNKAVIEKRSYKLLDNVAAVLAAHGEVKLIRIEGHTDDRGNDTYNLDL
ncbi:MAG: tandem-95 repeat protein, partial [Kofleriaceae bacterium]